jgi:hypothetical protein
MYPDGNHRIIHTFSFVSCQSHSVNGELGTWQDKRHFGSHDAAFADAMERFSARTVQDCLAGAICIHLT